VVDPELLTQTELTEVFLVGILTLSVAAQKLSLLAVAAAAGIRVIRGTQVIVGAAAEVHAQETPLIQRA
jgi:hypothetical protein